MIKIKTLWGRPVGVMGIRGNGSGHYTSGGGLEISYEDGVITMRQGAVVRQMCADGCTWEPEEESQPVRRGPGRPPKTVTEASE